MRIPIYQVDAFSAAVFGGNPAAICPLDRWLPDEVMQSIAAENNLSETAFIVRRNEGDSVAFDLRWFTPAIEVDLCGHATLGAAHIVFDRIDPDAEAIEFFTRSGPLSVTRENGLLAMDLPSSPPIPDSDLGDVAGALGAAPREVLNAMYGLAIFDDADDIRALTPDIDRIAALNCEAIIASAPGDPGSGVDFVSRFFAPKAGIPEDPVTGSAHCVLTPYWSARLGKKDLVAKQISRRGGEVHCRDLGPRVRIAGTVSPYLDGMLNL
ncbi:MAG: PhzF family phenazine biosynthesis protein [Alphaproteobacteria bacterium]|nr:PhzF family phenazine biosynthesis protein [Alphaproteobacteria bacterium]